MHYTFSAADEMIDVLIGVNLLNAGRRERERERERERKREREREREPARATNGLAGVIIGWKRVDRSSSNRGRRHTQ